MASSISCDSGYQYSTSLALAASLVLVLFASTAPCVEAQARPRPWSTTTPETTVSSVSFVNVTFVNNLTQTLNVTIGAPPSATPQSTTIAPGASAALSVDVEGPLQFQVNGALYIDDVASGHAGALVSLVAKVGVLSIVVVNGPCATGQAGLTLKGYVDGKLVKPEGCAVHQ